MKNKNVIEKMLEVETEMQADGYECEFYKDYSGRGMFGEQCCGFTVRDIAEVKMRMKQKGIKTSSCIDNMGLSYIVYYPSISIESGK
ncbi:MAG: hypothetical protein WCT77_02945 [Bacteroidota bacterium]